MLGTHDTRPLGLAELAQQLRRRGSNDPSWGGLFVLQMPIMLLSYAILAYLGGLLALIAKPLRKATEFWGDDCKVCASRMPY